MTLVPGRSQKEKVDGIAQRRRRELQVARAEGRACRTATETLCRDMVERRIELDAAMDEYKRRKAKLVEQETGAHERLTKVLQDRSSAESALEDVRDHAENVLKARRTADTVRAYRLDTRWRRLHGRYRGFVVDVLTSGSGIGSTLQQLQSPDAPRPPTKRFGRRFYTAADNLSARNRRESLRTSRSLHTLMAGYFRETFGGGDTQIPRKIPHRRSSSVLLDGAGPERVLNKLRVMQEQCARIAERVRRRMARGGMDAVEEVTEGVQPLQLSVVQDDRDGKHAVWQSDLLIEARQRLTAGHQYVAELRMLMNRTVMREGLEQLSLCKLLSKTCAACVGGKAQFDDSDSGGNHSVVHIAGRLERACFILFARLDRMGAAGLAAPSQQQQPHDRRVAHAHDVVASCLLAVQAHRMRTVHQARDIERRVHNFHKAVNRLLLATSAASGPGANDNRFRRDHPVSRLSHKTSSGRQDKATSTAGKPMPRKAQKKTFISTVSSPKTIPAVVDIVTTAELTSAATVKIVCPPSIGIIEYE